MFGGLFTILGANCCAELAAMMPRAGGQYVFIREAFGDLWAFLFGWTQFLIIQTGTNAAVAIAFAKYLGSLIPGLSETHVLVVIPLASLLPESMSHASARGPADARNQLRSIGCMWCHLFVDSDQHAGRTGGDLGSEPVHGVEVCGAGGVDCGRIVVLRHQPAVHSHRATDSPCRECWKLVFWLA